MIKKKSLEKRVILISGYRASGKTRLVNRLIELRSGWSIVCLSPFSSYQLFWEWCESTSHKMIVIDEAQDFFNFKDCMDIEVLFDLNFSELIIVCCNHRFLPSGVKNALTHHIHLGVKFRFLNRLIALTRLRLGCLNRFKKDKE